MSKTEFDARVVARNHRSNKIIDQVMKNSRSRVEKNMVDRVLRPFTHVLNECEIHDVDTDKVYDAVTAITGTMFVELLVRTMPQGNQTLLQGAVQTILDQFSETLLKSVSVNFNVDMQLATPAPQATPPLHS